MSQTAFISVGSNIGDRLENCKRAIESLARSYAIKVVKISSFYEAEPWGDVKQSWFINCVVAIETSLDGQALLALLHETEKGFGRSRAEKGGPRIIDLDILFLNGEIVKSGDLVVPHPLLHKRRFVLAPLNEIAPDFIHPVLKKPVHELLKDIDDNKKVFKVRNLNL